MGLFVIEIALLNFNPRAETTILANRHMIMMINVSREVMIKRHDHGLRKAVDVLDATRTLFPR